jgi:DNA modification methylase
MTTNILSEYNAFLRAKIKLAQRKGFDVPLEQINANLKPHTRDIVRWALAGGQRAVFASFGLHKTSTNLEVMRQIGIRHPDMFRLIILPLGVRQEFVREVAKRFTGEYAIELRFIRSDAEIAGPDILYMTNYESVREGKITISKFGAASLDEASVLRSYGSKTYQEFLPMFEPVEFKFVYTATPSPNRFKEMIHYAGFLGVMDTGQALTRFFQRDSEKAGNLTLYPHKEHEFWLWVASWAVFIQKPSDLGHSDEGYDLPAMEVRYHEVPSDYDTAGAEKNGQGLLIPNVAMGLSAAAGEKRDSMDARVAKVAEIMAASPDDHFLIWHDLEDERHAIQKAIPGVVSVWGTQNLDEREQRIADFCDGKVKDLSTKPSIAGSGTNAQAHCHREIFAGIGFKFNDFIQSIHRVKRFGQTKPVIIDIIHTEVEREVLKTLQEKWSRHDEMQTKMGEIIRAYGLDQLSMQDSLARTIGVERHQVKGEHFIVANNDCVLEAIEQPDNSVGLIVTSVPFANHYEYTPSYNDFGHTQDNAHFWAQMDFLTPQLLRILKPGRIACIHVKDRINFGNVTGLGFPTMDSFHEETVFHFKKHGFQKIGVITVVTDVVRENNQTYRLGYSEVCKDGTKMSVGCPEYVILLRKPQSDLSRGYADEPVMKSKPLCVGGDGELVPFDRALAQVPGTGYSVARWQVDAHAFWRTSGDRLLGAAELASYGPAKLAKMFTAMSLDNVYNYEYHVAVGENMLTTKTLPADYLSLAPGSHDSMVWHDIVRMRTLNGEQSARAVEKHVCPFQIDIVDRLINRYSNPGDVVYDPFCGLGTVPVRAMKLGRRGAGSELNSAYFADQVHYCQAMERQISIPTLFDWEALDADQEITEPA